jgi:bacterioferritin (cytochrome b1)
MDADIPTTDALREELQVVEGDLAQLRESAAELRRRIGSRDDPTDAEERSMLITTAEEQEALIEVLEQRREDLLRRLGEHG